jgi:type IV pilus assembly protein PilP
MNFIIRLLCLGASLLTLVSCGGTEGDDLDRFMEDAAKTMNTKVEPLPQVQPYVPLLFNVDGTISDPFRPKSSEHWDISAKFKPS